jgi:hypothetical protein
LAVIEGFDEKVDVATIESAIKKANGK